MSNSGSDEASVTAESSTTAVEDTTAVDTSKDHTTPKPTAPNGGSAHPHPRKPARSSAEMREAQRAARKQKILGNKDSRMTRVKGEYNQHRVKSHDSDDEDSLSRLLSDGSVTSSNCVVMETASTPLRVVVFLLAALSILSYQHVYQIEISLLTPYICIQVGLLTILHFRGQLFKQASSTPLLSRLLILLGYNADSALQTAKCALFLVSLITDFTMFYSFYQILNYYDISLHHMIGL